MCYKSYNTGVIVSQSVVIVSQIVVIIGVFSVNIVVIGVVMCVLKVTGVIVSQIVVIIGVFSVVVVVVRGCVSPTEAQTHMLTVRQSSDEISIIQTNTNQRAVIDL